MIQLQLISGACLVLALLYINYMVWARKFELKYALPWMGVIVLLIIVDLFPIILYSLSEFIGIATPVNTLFLLAFCFSIALIYVLTVTVSRLSNRIRQLSQVVAINEEKIDQLLNRVEGNEKNKII